MLHTQIDEFRGNSITSVNADKVKLTLQSTEYNFTKAAYKFMMLTKHCINFNWAEADKLSSKMGKESLMFVGLFMQTEFALYKSIALLKNSASKNLIQKSLVISKTNRALNKIQKWVDSVPENHQYKIWMIEGLLEEFKGNGQKALILLEKAALEAEKQLFTQNAAICYEFLSKTCTSLEYTVKSNEYKNKSLSLLKEWGYVKN
jgi:hypothetical protein